MPHPRALFDLADHAGLGLEDLSVPVLGWAALRTMAVVGCALALIFAGKALPF